MELFQEVHHELVTVMLHDGIEAPSQQLLKGRLDRPPLVFRGFAKDDAIELMEPVAEVKVVPRASDSFAS